MKVPSLLSAGLIKLLFLIGAPCWAEVNGITPENLVKRAEELDGKTIVVRGYLTFGYEDRNLWNSAESRKKWRERECVSLVNYGRLDEWKQYAGQEVLLEAVVRKDADQDGSIIRLGSCNKVALELIESKPPRAISKLLSK